MPWKWNTKEEFIASVVKKYGKRILKDMERGKRGEITLVAISKIYGFNQQYAGYVFHKIYNHNKIKTKARDNKDYLNHKLDGCNRGKVEGFKKYFSQRQFLFKDTFKTDYSDQNAEREFRSIGL